VLHEFVEHEATLLVAVSPELAPVGTQLRAAVADGKRLRGMFCYWGWRATGQGESDAAVRAAASMELVHAAALVHDDLIDDSAIRRGSPSTHVALRHAVPESRDRDAASRALAMLVGDLLMAWAGQLFASCGLPGAYVARVRPLWSTLARELVAGECLEVLRTGADAPATSFASMPACYALPQVAKLLSATHSLDYPANRMAATGQFTVYLMRPDAFEEGGRLLPAAQKVRLLHASIRHHLRRAGAWDDAAWGVPK